MSRDVIIISIIIVVVVPPIEVDSPGHLIRGGEELKKYIYVRVSRSASSHADSLILLSRNDFEYSERNAGLGAQQVPGPFDLWLYVRLEFKSRRDIQLVEIATRAVELQL